MGFKNNFCFIVAMALILLLSVGLVSASEVDSDVGVISNDNELLASNVGYVENGVPSDLNLKSTENVENDDSGKISSNQADSLGEDGVDDEPIDYHDANGMELIPSENPIVSEENYSVIFDWVEEGNYNDYAPEAYYENPWLMNDTTWAYCIEPGPSGADGYYYGAPGVYKRITLTDEQLIHPVTGEDVLPYIRTFLYYHYNDTENFTTVSSGKVSFPNVLWSFTDSQDYRNQYSHYNELPYSNPSWTYVKETIDMVKAGNGIPNSGSFHDTGLTYQFYLYSSINGRHYQNILGFNLFTNLSVIKEWDDYDNIANLRPENISVDLYLDGEPFIRGVTLDSDHNWEYTFNNLPLYSISNLTAPINADDYKIETVLEDDFDVTITKVWPEDYSNKPSRIYVNIYADGEDLGRVSLYRSRGYTTTLTNFNKYAEDGHEINYEFVDSTYPGSLDISKSEIYQVKHIKVSLTNDELKQAGKSIELVSDGLIYGGAILEEANDWTYTFLNLDKDSNVDIRERLDSNGVVHLANYTIKESEVRYYLSSVSSNSTSINPLMPSETKFFDDTEEKITSSIKITNKLELINLTVNKVWVDDDNRDGLRPDSVTFVLTGTDGKTYSYDLVAGEDWTHTFDNLPVYYNNGVKIVYTVDEEEFEHYANYTKSVSGYTITNTHEIELTSVTVSKVWEDKGDFYGKRPSDVTINVFQNGEIVNSIVLNKDNGWKYELKNLPKYDNGKLINYSIDEVNITYYHYKIEENGNYSFTVTNTLNKVHVFKWSWKLIGEKVTPKESKAPKVPKVPNGKLPKKGKLLGNGKSIGKYQSKKAIPNKNKKSFSHNRNQQKPSDIHFEPRQKFRLFIYLYNQFFFGNMTYEDFVAVLKENGIKLDESNNWDSNGTLEFDYDNIEDVPDSIELSDNSDHFEDSSDKIDKDKPVSDSGVIDSGDVEVEEVYVEE